MDKAIIAENCSRRNVTIGIGSDAPNKLIPAIYSGLVTLLVKIP